METIKRLLTLWILLFFGLSVFSQENQEEIKIPELDSEKNTYILDLKEDAKFSNLLSAYMEGSTEGDSLRFLIKGKTFPQAFIIAIAAPGDDERIHIDIVKKHWKDFLKNESIQNGIYEDKFRVAGDFGIIISSPDKDVNFRLAVWSTPEIIPETKSLFVPAGNWSGNRENQSNVNTVLSSHNDRGSEENNDWFKYAIIFLTVIVIGLLLLILRKKRVAKVWISILFLSSTSLYAGARQSSFTGFTRGRVGATFTMKQISEMIAKLNDVYNKAESVEKLVNDWLDANGPSEQPDMDPAGQPTMPTSCLSAFNPDGGLSSNMPHQNGGGNDQTINDDLPNDSNTSSNESAPNSTDSNSEDGANVQSISILGEADQPKLPDIEIDQRNESVSREDVFMLPIYDLSGNIVVTGGAPKAQSNITPREESVFILSDSYSYLAPRRPKYDNDGYLISTGDYPNAPKYQNPDVKASEAPYRPAVRRPNIIPTPPRYNANGDLIDVGDYPNAPSKIQENDDGNIENPFILSEVRVSRAPFPPKYDKDGYIIDAENYPNAPSWVDPETGLPLFEPYIDRPSANDEHLRQPKYDKDGNLLSFGDYPNAPKKIDPERVGDQDYIMELNQQNINDNGGQKSSSANSSTDQYNQEDNTEDFNSENTDNPEDNSATDYNSSSGSGTDSNEAGCECLKKAYTELQAVRLTFERLRIISQRMDKKVQWGLSVGDGYSSTTGIGSVAWQMKKVKIMKSLAKFDRTYKNKYGQLLAELHDSLLKIDQCEQLLGFENWYGVSGFIYYEFMKSRYATYK